MGIETKPPSTLQTECRTRLRKSQMKSGWKAKAPIVVATCGRQIGAFYADARSANPVDAFYVHIEMNHCRRCRNHATPVSTPIKATAWRLISQTGACWCHAGALGIKKTKIHR